MPTSSSLSKSSGPSSPERVLRLCVAAGIGLAAAGVLVDLAPIALPLHLADATGGMVLTYLGGGGAMVAATALAGYGLFAPEAQPEDIQENP